MSKKKREEELESLQNLLDDTQEADVNEIPPETAVARRSMVNFDDLREDARKEAKNTVMKYVKGYLSAEMMQEEYIKSKIKVDVEGITSIVYQLKTAEHALTRGLEELEAGNASHYMFNSIVSLQGSLRDLNKDMKQYTQIIEKEYEDFSRNYEEYREFMNHITGQEGPKLDKNKTKKTQLEENIHRGGKGILKALDEDGVEEHEAEEIDEDE